MVVVDEIEVSAEGKSETAIEELHRAIEIAPGLPLRTKLTEIGIEDQGDEEMMSRKTA